MGASIRQRQAMVKRVLGLAGTGADLISAGMQQAAAMQVDTFPDTEARMAEARRNMVDGQLRPNRVTDPRLIAAMGELPRERFLPPGMAARAYVDGDVRLSNGRGLIEPRVIARLLQLLAIRDGDRVLVVGAGTGYAAAVAAQCGARVVGLEEDAEMLAVARRATAGLVAPGALRLVQGPLAEGHASAAPYDAILIEGGVPAVPEAISGQLAEGGRLATVLTGSARAASRGR